MYSKFTLVLLGVCLCTLAFIPQASANPYAAPDGDRFSLEQIEKKTKPLLKHLPTYNLPYVRNQVKIYMGNGRFGSEVILGRAPMYFPLIEQELRKRNMPAELKYLPIVESHLNPRARSHRGAVGLWQFMPRTARHFGLTINEHIDERRDVRRSTEKALDYLKSLHKQYGNWALAVSAYNCGTPNLDKAIRAAGSKDYLKVVHYLPQETQKYISRIAAAAYLINYYQQHRLTPRYPDLDMLDTRSYEVSEAITFEKLAVRTGVDAAAIRSLNPQFNNNRIPGGNTYLIRLPHGVQPEQLQATL